MRLELEAIKNVEEVYSEKRIEIRLKKYTLVYYSENLQLLLRQKRKQYIRNRKELNLFMMIVQGIFFESSVGIYADCDDITGTDKWFEFTWLKR